MGGEPIPCKSEVCTQDDDFSGPDPTCCVKAEQPVKAQMCAEGASDGTTLKCDEDHGWVPKYTTKPKGGELFLARARSAPDDFSGVGDNLKQRLTSASRRTGATSSSGSRRRSRIPRARTRRTCCKAAAAAHPPELLCEGEHVRRRGCSRNTSPGGDAGSEFDESMASKEYQPVEESEYVNKDTANTLSLNRLREGLLQEKLSEGR